MEKFINACVSILPKPLQNIYHKYEEQMMYLIFGCLTTAVSILTKLLVFYFVPAEPNWESTAAVTISWICAVTFAFFTNKKYVFKNETKNAQEYFKVFCSFYGARLATLGMEEAIFLIFYDWLGFDKIIITLVSQVLIFVANYILSKLFVFKKDKNTQQGNA